MLKNFFMMIIAKIKNFSKKKDNSAKLTIKKKINKSSEGSKAGSKPIISNKKNSSSHAAKKTNHTKKMKK